MKSIAPLVEENIAFLEQGIDLLAKLDDAMFADPPNLGLGAVGGHFRHCLDVYLCFFDGLEAKQVDYDARCRDPRIEVDRSYAAERFEEIKGRLHELDERGEESVAVSVDRCAQMPAEAAFSSSTIHRELQFLRSHTVHHYALISALLRVQGFDPGADFGVAPSTLEYRRRLAR